MFDLAGGQVGFATIWLLGVSMGLTACTVTCLPFMGTWALGRASGTAEAFRHTFVFLSGRILTYTLLAASAGMAGLGLAKALGGVWGNTLIGGASVVAGLWLLLRSGRSSSCASASTPSPVQPVRFRRKADAMPPFALGATLALTPCTPLASLMALAATSESGWLGAGYGLAFGLGAAMTPILILVPLAGRLGRELRCGRPMMSRWLLWAAAGVLILLGLKRLGIWALL